MQRWGRVHRLRAALFLLAASTIAGCSSPPPLELRSTPAEEAAVQVPPRPAPSGTVRVAYPEEPAAWHPALLDEAAAVDLAALWGLPLYRIDPHGQLRPALARDATTRALEGGGFEVEVALRAGRWSDDTPVVAADVVATLDALRATPGGAGLEPLVATEAVDAHTVRLRFAEPYARWPYLLAGGWSVLPAHVLGDDGIDAYRDAVPVSGGWFRLVEHEPGRRAVFAAHPDSPLGAPRLAEVVVDLVPSYETALGLLRDGRVDAVMGHLALNPLARAERVHGVEAGAPVGGTWVLIRWREAGSFGGLAANRVERRRLARDGIDLGRQVEGLFGPFGEVAAATVPGLDGPWASQRSPTSLAGHPVPSLLVPRWQEALGFTARALQRDLRARNGGAELVRLEPDHAALQRATRGDGALVVRRDLPRPPLLGRAPQGASDALRALLWAADAAGRADAPEGGAAQLALYEDGHELPLYRIAVAHVWSPRVAGIRPSAWPGIGLWDVGQWRVGDPPEP